MTITFSRGRGRKVNKNDDGGNNNKNAASTSPALSSRCQSHQAGVSVTTFLSSEEEKERNMDDKVSVKPFSDFEYKGRWASTSISISPCRHPYPKRRRSEPKIPRKAATDAEGTNISVLNLAKVSPSALEEEEVYRISNGDYKIMAREFFECDALELAPKLLGKLIRRDDVILQITEVEAYRQNDTACHGRFGITARTAPVFGPGGHSYVYLCYGLHIMLNVVADKEGVGAAVLIRSCAPISGLETIQSRRGQSTNKPILLTGPGKVGQALGLTTEWSNHPLYIRGGLEVLDGPAPEKILVGPRVGIEYASPEDVQALWRFAIAGTAWISAPRNTLRPA